LIGLKRTFPTESEILTPLSGGSYAKILFNLAGRFWYMNCLEHALEAIHDAVDLYRQLAADHPHAFNPDLAESLNNLSYCQSGLGRRERALEAIQEAVDLRRQLAADRPEAFNPDFAESLNNLSNRLSDLGHRKRALEAIQEAVDLRRQLAAGHLDSNTT
jgi:tetratricopeptide (TPR) repeat protein